MKEIQIDKNSFLFKALKTFSVLSWDEITDGIDSCALKMKILYLGVILLFIGVVLSAFLIVGFSNVGDMLAWLVFIILNGFVEPTDQAISAMVIICFSILFAAVILNKIYDFTRSVRKKFVPVVPQHVVELYQSAKGRFCKKVVFVSNEK